MNSPVISVRVSDGSVIKLECHDALPSTARLAKEYAKLGYPDRYVVFAEGRKKLDADDKEFGEIYTQIMANPNMQAYEAARAEIDKLMQYINSIFALCLQGEDPATCEPPKHDHECGGECSSCSGCH